MLTNSNHKGIMQQKPVINISKFGDSTNEQSKYSLHTKYGEQHHNDDRNINYNDDMNADYDDDVDNNNEDKVRKDSKKSTQNAFSELSNINVTGETSKKKDINQLEVLSVQSLKSSTSVTSSPPPPPVNMSILSSASTEILNNPPMLRRGIAYLDMDDGDCTIEEDDEEDQSNEYLKHYIHTSNFNVSMINCSTLSNSAPHMNYHLPINDIFHHFLR
ncbi:unnamed protein product [Trichobilharzia szidati]|nr:unnamed protein product [Trichobilharzia szidati]